MKKIILFLMFILLLPIAYALPYISINQTEFNIESKAENSKNVFFSITNKGNESLYNLTFEPLNTFAFPKINKIDKNQTIVSSFSVLATEVYEKDLNVKLYFNYEVGIPAEPRTFIVNSTRTQFESQITTIKQNDKITFFNKDNITHRIKAISSSDFDVTITPSNSQDVVLSEIKEITYVNEVGGFPLYSGLIKVENATKLEYIRNEAYDIPLIFHHKVTDADTSLTLNVFIANIEMKYNGTYANSLTIKNSGSSTAKNVKLTDNLGWAIFNENNFNLDSGQSKLVNFNIKPSIAITSETNKTYQMSISANGTNFQSLKTNLEIEIDYNEILNVSLTNLTREQLIELQQETDKKIKELIEVLKILLQQGNASASDIIYFDPTLNFTANASTIRDMFIAISELKSNQERIDGELNGRIDTIETGQTNVGKDINGTAQDIKEIKEDKKSEKIWGYVWKSFVLIGLILGGLFLYFKYDKIIKSNEDVS